MRDPRRRAVPSASIALLAALVLAPAARGSTGPSGPFAAPPAVPDRPAIGSAFAVPAPWLEEPSLASRGMTRGERAEAEGEETGRRRLPHALSGERARLMLRSLTVPGWGQATLGQRREALVFGLLELGVWGSFTAFRIQGHMRRETYERTARLFAGIDLQGRDEEYRRIIGLYLSSEEYNRLVVRRDAANLHFGDPAAYDAYIAAHEVTGADAWSWDSVEDLLRYRSERQATQRAIKRAHDALAAALINRLLSVVHASRSGGRAASDATSWRLECVPAPDDPTGLRFGLRAGF